MPKSHIFEGEEVFDVSDAYPDFSEQIWEHYRSTNHIEHVTGMEFHSKNNLLIMTWLMNKELLF